MKEEKNRDKIIIGISILILILITMPLMYIAKYNHSCADDYSYGILTHQKWEETHSIIEIIKTGIEQAKITYVDWQGTFSAIFLMALQPAIFGEQFYWMTTFIMMSAYIFATIYILKVILIDYFQCSRKIYWIITSALITISLQFLPYPVESLYWFNGSIYYTFFYSLMLILIGKTLKIIKINERKNLIINFIVSVILAIAVGASNYTTALVCNLILASITLILILKKDKKSIYVGSICLICLISLLISAKAPGNAVRQSSLTKTPAIKAIMYSFEFAIYFFGKFTNYSIIIFYVILIPLLLKIIKKTDYKFKMPIIFTIFTFCIYASQFTPPIYAQSGYIPQRLLDIIYFSSYWLIIINMTYWLGYINRKFNIEETNNKYLYPIFIILILIGIGTNYSSMNSYIAIKSLQSGEAQEYDYEMKERIKLYQDENLKDVEVEKVNNKPYLLFCSDISKDEENWMNKAVADYYNKNSVKRK